MSNSRVVFAFTDVGSGYPQLPNPANTSGVGIPYASGMALAQANGVAVYPASYIDSLLKEQNGVIKALNGEVKKLQSKLSKLEAAVAKRK